MGLVEQINYDNLKDRIEEIEKEDLSIYSEATAARLKEKIAEAKEALKNENITNEELQEELAGLNEKYSSLKLNHEPGSVEELIKRIEEMDLSGYSEASVKEQESLEKAKRYAAQKKELLKRKKAEESKKRTHRLCQVGGAVESVLGATIEEEDIPKLIGFLKKQEANGKFFSKAMQKETNTDMEEV